MGQLNLPTNHGALSLGLLLKNNPTLVFKFPLHPELKRLVMSFNLFIRTLALNAALMLAVREATAWHFLTLRPTPLPSTFGCLLLFIDGYGAAGNILGGKLLGAKDYGALWQLTKK